MNFKTNYTEEEWTKRKDYYITQIQSIVLPTDPTGIELKSLNALNSNLLSQAYMDKATISEHLDKTSKLIEIYEAECFINMNWDDLSANRSSKDKLLSKEKDAYVTAFIRKKTGQGGLDIFQKELLYSSRNKFIETIVFNLKDNASSLNALYSLLKLETLQSGNMM